MLRQFQVDLYNRLFTLHRRVSASVFSGRALKNRPLYTNRYEINDCFGGQNDQAGLIQRNRECSKCKMLLFKMGYNHYNESDAMAELCNERSHFRFAAQEFLRWGRSGQMHFKEQVNLERKTATVERS